MPGLRCPRLFLFLCCRSRHVIRRRDIDPALFKKSPAPSPSPRSGSGSGLGIGNGSGKGKGKRKSGRVNRTPVELVRDTRELLVALDLSLPCPKWEDQLTELSKNIREMTLILYGSTESEPVAEACAQLTREFFQDDTIRLFFVCLPKLDLEARKDVTRVVANLQRQPVQSRIIACEYLEQHTDLIDFLVLGYENMDYALHYGRMLRECIRHQSIARYLLESEKLKKFFSYVELPNFDIASDATATFMELLTRHKLTVSEFLTRKYDWFFTEYNGRLLESPNYITRRFAVKLLGDILLDRSNATVTMRYVSSKENLQILMNLLREPSKNIQIMAFHIFKVFVINKNKPPEIVSILLLNRPKLLRFFSNFTTEKEDEQFDLDKAHVVKEIAGLESKEKI